jgi:hypothetical protein
MHSKNGHDHHHANQRDKSQIKKFKIEGKKQTKGIQQAHYQNLPLHRGLQHGLYLSLHLDAMPIVHDQNDKNTKNQS